MPVRFYAVEKPFLILLQSNKPDITQTVKCYVNEKTNFLK